MPDVLIRDLTAEDLALLDEQARRVGLSRSEFLRRQLHREAQRLSGRVTTSDLVDLAHRIGDLGDPDVMTDAWS